MKIICKRKVFGLCKYNLWIQNYYIFMWQVSKLIVYWYKEYVQAVNRVYEERKWKVRFFLQYLELYFIESGVGEGRGRKNYLSKNNLVKRMIQLDVQGL